LNTKISELPLGNLHASTFPLLDVQLPVAPLDRALLAAIQDHFKDRPSDDLLAILIAEGLEEWSPEALAAARYLLRERAAGRLPEPNPPQVIVVPPRSFRTRVVQFLVELGLLTIALALGVGLAWALTRWSGDVFTGVCFGLPLGLTAGGVLRRLLLGVFRPARWLRQSNAEH
jgi:hypothetical protein